MNNRGKLYLATIVAGLLACTGPSFVTLNLGNPPPTVLETQGFLGVTGTSKDTIVRVATRTNGGPLRDGVVIVQPSAANKNFSAFLPVPDTGLLMQMFFWPPGVSTQDTSKAQEIDQKVFQNPVPGGQDPGFGDTLGWVTAAGATKVTALTELPDSSYLIGTPSGVMHVDSTGIAAASLPAQSALLGRAVFAMGGFWYAGGSGSLIRTTTGGTQDMSFGTGGSYAVPGANAWAYDPAGRVVAAGMNVTAFNTGGDLDSTFGEGGMTPLPSGVTAFAVTAAPDGTYWVGGGLMVSADLQQSAGYALLHLGSDGFQDERFGNGGEVVGDAIQNDTGERIVLVAQASNGVDILTSVVARPDGSVLILQAMDDGDTWPQFGPSVVQAQVGPGNVATGAGMVDVPVSVAAGPNGTFALAGAAKTLPAVEVFDDTGGSTLLAAADVIQPTPPASTNPPYPVPPVSSLVMDATSVAWGVAAPIPAGQTGAVTALVSRENLCGETYWTCP